MLQSQVEREIFPFDAGIGLVGDECRPVVRVAAEGSGGLPVIGKIFGVVVGLACLQEGGVPGCAGMQVIFVGI